jgi:hypothetical protein
VIVYTWGLPYKTLKPYDPIPNLGEFVDIRIVANRLIVNFAFAEKSLSKEQMKPKKNKEYHLERGLYPSHLTERLELGPETGLESVSDMCFACAAVIIDIVESRHLPANQDESFGTAFYRTWRMEKQILSEGERRIRWGRDEEE